MSDTQHKETMKDIQDIMDKSLDHVVNTMKEEETETETETYFEKLKSKPYTHLGISLGLISVILGVYMLKR